MKLTLAVMLSGVVLAAGSALALATGSTSRGGHAVPVVKRETPRLPKQTGSVVYRAGGAIGTPAMTATRAAP